MTLFWVGALSMQTAIVVAWATWRLLKHWGAR